MGNLLNIVVISVLVLVSIGMFVLAFAKPKQQGEITTRLEKFKVTHEVVDAKDIEKRYSKLKIEIVKLTKNLNPLADKLLNDKNRKTLTTKFIKAGKYDADPTAFVATRILLAIAFPLIFLALSYSILDFSFEDILTYAPIVALAGYFLPIARLNREIDERQKRIFRSLPTLLDLLTVCLEAGMGINEALTKVVEKSQAGDLKDEIERTLKEIQIGNPRLQALRDMAKRVDMTELSSVIISIIQAEQMGTSLAKTLKIQSEVIRDIRWQKAQEMAQKAPIKMIIPIALFIFPTIFIIIFGPLAINFILGN